MCEQDSVGREDALVVMQARQAGPLRVVGQRLFVFFSLSVYGVHSIDSIDSIVVPRTPKQEQVEGVCSSWVGNVRGQVRSGRGG